MGRERARYERWAESGNTPRIRCVAVIRKTPWGNTSVKCMIRNDIQSSSAYHALIGRAVNSFGI